MTRSKHARDNARRLMGAVADRTITLAPYEVTSLGAGWIRNTASRYGLRVAVLPGGGMSVVEGHESLLTVERKD